MFGGSLIYSAVGATIWGVHRVAGGVFGKIFPGLDNKNIKKGMAVRGVHPTPLKEIPPFHRFYRYGYGTHREPFAQYSAQTFRFQKNS